MLAAVEKRGLCLVGFSEHSPRPAGYDYTHEYRDQLTRFLPVYVEEVQALKNSGNCRVLLGLEMDWLDGQEDFIEKSINAYDYDYIIGSVHFLDCWGFDDGRDPWNGASQEICERRYERYFHTWRKMIASGFFQIAAHPDLIKIYSRDQFHLWLQKPEALELVRACLLALRDSGMAMEISSAGLRKACKEIYPAPEIMEIAANLALPVSMASDAHCVKDVGADFDVLAAYAKKYGFSRQTIFNRGKRETIPF